MSVKEITKKIVQPDTQVVVGKFYNVRCAVMVEHDGAVSHWAPIIGEAHNDNQFGVPDKHFHLDGRFCNDRHFEIYMIDNNGFCNQILSYKKEVMYNTVREVVIKKLKCRRLTTGINPPKEKTHNLNGKPMKNLYHNWCRSMVGKSCAGKKCPHLGTAMIERKGELVCPLHDLRGDLKTNEITLHPSCLQI